MSLKTPSVSNPESKLTKCKNCRQDIASEKMFLHEGFCHRNNVFCEHCEKVFLKKDYDEHLKDLRNSINSSKSTDIDENEQIPIMPVIKQTVTTTINPSTVLEFVEMPLIEEYTINNPIVISESGCIVSSQNKNEFILPSLGINAMHQEYGIDYEKYFSPLTDVKGSINYTNNNVDIFNNYININSENIFINNNNYQQNVFYNNNNNINNFSNNSTNEYQYIESKTMNQIKEPKDNYYIDLKKNLFPKDKEKRIISPTANGVKILEIKKKVNMKTPNRFQKKKRIKLYR